MSTIPIIDGHIDLAWNEINLGRHFEDSIEIKHSSESNSITEVEGITTVGYPEIKKGNIRILLSTIWIETEKSLFPSLGKKYHDSVEASMQALEQYEYYQSLCINNDYSFVTNREQLKKVIESPEYHFGIVPIIEGADFIESKNNLDEWLNKGIRIIAPVWQKNHIGGCSELGGGLSEYGKELMRSLSMNNVIVDISHMSDRSIAETFECFDGIIIDSHTTCRKFVNEERLINDSQIAEIGRRKGIIGLMTWDKKLKNSLEVTIDDYIDHIDHIADIMGNIDCVGIGSSMDGGYGAESLPHGMDDISSLSLLDQALSKRGYSSTDIEKILYRNWYRVLFCAFNT